MLQSLDTLIAFVVIMTIASLFVTIIVQMLSAALSLRGKNLANALALTFQTVDPSLGNKAHELAARILCDPLLSDSMRTRKSKPSPSAAGARTKPWHFANPWGAMRLASAIRPEEVYAAIKDLASSTDNGKTKAAVEKGADSSQKTPTEPEKHDSLPEAAARLLKALGGTPTDTADMVKAQADALVRIAGRIPDAALKERLVAAVQETGAAQADILDPARARLETWFNAAQDRAQQWFQLHTRGLTIGASVVVALVLQLDAVEIFHYVSTNAAGRAALVASVEKVIKEGDGVLDEKGGLIKRIADAWNTNYPGLKVESLAGIIHTGQLEDAITNRYGKGTSTFKTKEELDDGYNKLVAATTRAYYKDQSQKISDLTKGVSATGFDLKPPGFWRWPDPSGSDLRSLLKILDHLFGILLFSALLTLGAPYWYNMLKNLSSLRPALAQLIGKEKTGQPKGGNEPQRL